MNPEKMKAMVFEHYGPPDVLQLQEVKKPVCGDQDVLIKIVATTIVTGDCEIRSFTIPALYWLPLRLYIGLRKPRIKILGQELAGVIESVGVAVTNFRKGDLVFAATKMSMGAYAEFICLPAKHAIAIKPPEISFETASTIPTGGLNGLHFIRKASLQHGQSLLVNGAGGSIGTYIIQIAKSMGVEVTAVDSALKLDMLRSIGADHVIDYAQEDFTQNGKTYDAIIDVIGTSSFTGSIGSLKQDGRYILGNPTFSGMARGWWTSMTTHKKVISALAAYKTEDMIFLKDLIQSGKIKPVIDKYYPLHQMAEAHRYIESGSKKGHVVITLETPA